MDLLTAADLSGLWVPIVTPFDSSDAIDEASLARLAAEILTQGATGLVPLGTTGEPATLTPAERQRVVEVCADAAAASQRPLIVGVGSNCTRSTLQEVDRLAVRTQVGAALVVAPYYIRPSVDAVVEHFRTVADHSPVPVVIYNIPYRTGVSLPADALLAAAEHPNIIGLKQSVGALDLDTLRILADRPRDFAVLAGDDAFIVPSILMGASGAISAAAHLCTEQFAALVAEARQGTVTKAVERSHRLLEVVRAGFAEPSPAVWKGALAVQGQIACAAVRRPLLPASSEAVDAVMRALRMSEPSTFSSANTTGFG